MNGTHQLLVYADHVNMLDKNKNTMKKDTEALLEASREKSWFSGLLCNSPETMTSTFNTVRTSNVTSR